jgi:hypothetical protein
MCKALIGLWEAWQSGLIAEAEVDFNQGVKGLRCYLEHFDHASWSLYSLNSGVGKPLLASPYYHRANALLAQIIGYMSGDPLFVSYGTRWLQTSKSMLQRIQMSLRIGLDRYCRVPSLLHTDISKKG